MNVNTDGGTKLKTELLNSVAPMRMFQSKYVRPVFSPDEEAAAAAVAEAARIAAEKAEADKKAAEEAEKAKTSGLSEEAAKLLKEQMKTKQKLEEANAKLKEFEGIDPVAIKKLLADQAAAEKAAAEAKGDFERVKKMMADEHAAELKKAKDELEAERKKTSEISGRVIELTVGQSFAQSEFLKQTVLPAAKARAIYGAHFEVEDGVVVAFDKPRTEGNRTKLVDASGTPLGFEAAIKKIVEADPDQDSILRSKLGAGAGSGSGNDVRSGDRGGKQPEVKGASRIEAILNARKAAGK